MTQTAGKMTDSTEIIYWMQHPLSLIVTDKGFKVRHSEGREVYSDNNRGACFIVDEKGQLAEDGIADPALGRLSLELLDVTEKLRLDWVAMQALSH